MFNTDKKNLFKQLDWPLLESQGFGGVFFAAESGKKSIFPLCFYLFGSEEE